MNAKTWQRLKPLFQAALDLGPAERSIFLAKSCNGDDDLRAQVEQLLASHDAPGHFLVSPALVGSADLSSEIAETDLGAGLRIGPYEVVRQLGRGGMGIVFLAVRADDQYRKQVAIKLIKRGMDTDLILRRFMMERQILANLEHPNIARLLEGGSTADGLPYFVMEYIEGQPITEYCNSREFNNSERLELFRQVCSALHYAHQNLVVHRDIKPSNILVTAEGVPKLLDFGIAKLLGPSWEAGATDATASMLRLMTPEYASPEQLRGLAITTGSDVYSLGVVLYELLSGRHPYRLVSRQPSEVAKVILREEPEKPSLAASRQMAEGGNPTNDGAPTTGNEPGGRTSPQPAPRNPKALRGDLDNIVFKALRKEPERRYASAQEFSEDIRRHLEGLPVTASPDTFVYRAGKFLQRHKAGALAAAAVALTLLTATVITAWQARVARAERAKAERRFNQVRALANSVLFDYHDHIAKLPGSTPIRQKMIQDALRYLDNLSSESGGDIDLQRELAAAYEKIGDVLGNPYDANLGNQEAALGSYRKALSIREALHAANPTDANIRVELGRAYTRVGDILWARGENQEALANYRKAVAKYTELLQAEPKNLEYLRALSRTLIGAGNVQQQMGDFKGALETYRANLAKAEVILTADTADKISRFNVGIANLKTGDALVELTNYDEALAQYEKSLVDLSQLAASDKTDATAARAVALTYTRLAYIYSRQKQFEKAASLNLKAIAEQKQMAAADPTNVQIQFDIAETYGNLSDNYLQMKRFAAALANVRESIRIFTETLNKGAETLQTEGYLGSTYVTYAKILAARGDVSGTIAIYHKALSILEREPVRKTQTKVLANAYEGMGDSYIALASNRGEAAAKSLAQWREARSWFQKSQDIYQALRDVAKLTGEDSTRLNLVMERITKCDAAIASLASRPQ